MKKLAPCLLLAALLCLSSCSSIAQDLDPTDGPSVKAYLKTLNKEAREGNAPYRYRISADGTAFEKYPATDFDKIRDEIDTAMPRQIKRNDIIEWDILAGLAVCEEDRGGDIDPVIVETRELKRINGFYREAWIIDRKGTIVEYMVTAKPIGDKEIEYKFYPL